MVLNIYFNMFCLLPTNFQIYFQINFIIKYFIIAIKVIVTIIIIKNLIIFIFYILPFNYQLQAIKINLFIKSPLKYKYYL